MSRLCLFGDEIGAEAYLERLRTNVSDVIGEVRWRKPCPVGESGSVFLDAGCGCHSDLPTYLAGWRRGSTALTLLADGDGVDRRRFEALARELDAGYEGAG